MASSVSPINDSSRIFDNGPGTGMLTSVILEQYPLASITAADVSSGMIGGLKANNWKTVNTLVADASDLRAARLEDQTFTHSMGTFFLPFVPYPQQVIAEMSRVTQPGGVVAVSTWSRISWVTPWTEARRTIEPDYIAPPLFHTGTTEREDVEDLFNKAGLSNVSVKAVECPHPKKASVDEAVDQFYNVRIPMTMTPFESYADSLVCLRWGTRVYICCNVVSVRRS